VNSENRSRSGILAIIAVSLLAACKPVTIQLKVDTVQLGEAINDLRCFSKLLYMMGEQFEDAPYGGDPFQALAASASAIHNKLLGAVGGKI
jgi:hypothetical protein